VLELFFFFLLVFDLGIFGVWFLVLDDLCFGVRDLRVISSSLV
jgi:hypothetical protein